MIGGFPVLAREWGRGRSLKEYLEEALTDPTSFLVVSAERALSAEFHFQAPRAILAAIGSGVRAHSAILARTGLSTTTVNDTLAALRQRGVINRLTPYSIRASRKTVLWEVVDPYMRFWLRFVDEQIDLIERGRGSLLLESFEGSWPAYRGRTIEPLIREAIELLLPDEERFGPARYVGNYWTRSGGPEVDLVGGDLRPVAERIGFVGSIKWRETRSFGRADAFELARHREQVPGTDDETPLIGVSSQGFDADVPLDVSLAADDLVEAFRGSRLTMGA